MYLLVEEEMIRWFPTLMNCRHIAEVDYFVENFKENKKYFFFQRVDSFFTDRANKRTDGPLSPLQAIVRHCKQKNIN